MKDPNWKSILELVPDALAVAPELRDAFLDHACRKPDGTPDPELRLLVTTLIASSIRADESDALASPIPGIVASIANEGIPNGETNPDESAHPDPID